MRARERVRERKRDALKILFKMRVNDDIFLVPLCLSQ